MLDDREFHYISWSHEGSLLVAKLFNLMSNAFIQDYVNGVTKG